MYPIEIPKTSMWECAHIASYTSTICYSQNKINYQLSSEPS